MIIQYKKYLLKIISKLSINKLSQIIKLLNTIITTTKSII